MNREYYIMMEMNKANSRLAMEMALKREKMGMHAAAKRYLDIALASEQRARTYRATANEFPPISTVAAYK